jgi:DNA-binding CsgD family transcriptional regulator
MRSAAQVGHYQDGIAIGEAALKDRDLTSAWRARLEAWLAVLLLLSGQSQRGEARAFDALRHAALAADPMATASAHQAAALGAGTAEAMAHTDSALAALGDDPESADLRLSLLHNRLSWLMRLGDEQELERTLALALGEAERAGTVGAVAILGAVAHVRYRQGRWDEALALLERIGPEFRSLPRGIRLRAVGSLIASHRGDQAAAAGYLGADGPAAPRWPDSPEPGVSNLIVARALVAEATGDLDQAVAAVASWLALPAPLRRHLDCDDAPDLVRVTLAADAGDTARALVAALEEDAAADPVAGRILAAQCGRAQLTGDPAALVAVAATYQQLGWPMRRGLALEEAAERYAHGGQRSAARDALTEAAAAYSGPGAAWDTRRADARLRPHRVRRGPHSTHRTEATGWAALTPAEAQVALLAVEGMANADIATRLFVSQRTVEAHVSQILAKLQIRSRAELARAYAQQVPHWGNGR